MKKKITKELEQSLLSLSTDKLERVSEFINALHETDENESIIFSKPEKDDRRQISILKPETSLKMSRHLDVLKRTESGTLRSEKKGSLHSFEPNQRVDTNPLIPNLKILNCEIQNGQNDLPTTTREIMEATMNVQMNVRPPKGAHKDGNSEDHQLVEVTIIDAVPQVNFDDQTVQVNPSKVQKHQYDHVDVFSPSDPPKVVDGKLEHYLISTFLVEGTKSGLEEIMPDFEYSLSELGELYACDKMVEIESSQIVIKKVHNDIGKGVICCKPIQKGGYLKYLGEIIPKSSRSDICMVFGDDHVIDCVKYRSIAYYMNHSCEPNMIFEAA
jgi:hypothetical protein